MPRGRRRFIVLVGLAAIAGAGAWRGERAVEARAGTALRRAGFSAGEVRFSWLRPLRLHHVSRTMPGGSRLTVETIGVRWGLFGDGDPRSHITGLRLRGVRVARGPLSMEWPAADFDVTAWTRESGGQRIALRQPTSVGTIEATLPWGAGEGRLHLSRLDVDAAAIQWNGETVMNPGLWTGRATFARLANGFRSEGTFQAEQVRLTPPRPLQPQGGEGLPTAIDVGWDIAGTVLATEVRRLTARLRGLDVSAQGMLPGGPDAPAAVDLEARCDLGEAFRTAGLTLPIQIPHAHRLGQADLDLSARGLLEKPGRLAVEPRLRFVPEPEALRALSYLRGPFPYRPDRSPGLVVDVREGSPDFIPIGEVPALLQRALLLSEDAGFRQHSGIDVAEIVAAWAEKEEEGRVRGASTITQQLVKNLFLSGEKTYGRKLKEAALALLVDAAVPKDRLLEIYVNVIEWGPRLHGLVPAARHYFDKRPDELTPKETAFLVCLIPNPVRYHQAHEAGRIGPGMEQIIHNLLAKLRSVEALGEDEHQQALMEELAFAPETAS